MSVGSDTPLELRDDEVCPVPDCDIEGAPVYLHHHFHIDHSEYEWVFALSRFFEDPDERSEYVEDEDIPDTERRFSPKDYDARVRSALEHHPVFSEDLAVAMFGSLSKAISSPAKEYVDDEYKPDFHQYYLDRYKNKNEDRIKDIRHSSYGPKWGKKKWFVHERDGFACRLCGTSVLETETRRIDVHHITPGSEFDSRTEMNDPSNLITLCKSCHGKHEGEHPDATQDEWPDLVTEGEQLVQ